MSRNDWSGHDHEPLFLVPWIVPAFAGLFAAIHLVLELAPGAYKAWAFAEFALVPWRFTTGDAGQTAMAVLNLFTYSLLHYDWAHVLINSALLTAAAGPVYRNCGSLRLIVLFAFCSIVGGLCHIAVHWFDNTAVIGASAGAAGLIAAAIRYRARRLSQGEIVAPMMRPPVLTFTLFWVGLNLALLLWDLIGGGALSGYATMAHIGGYMAGLLAAPLVVRGVSPGSWPSKRHLKIVPPSDPPSRLH